MTWRSRWIRRPRCAPHDRYVDAESAVIEQQRQQLRREKGWREPDLTSNRMEYGDHDRSNKPVTP